MCGIAGWVDFRRNIYSEDGVMAKISQTLAERGPDEHGSFKTNEAYLVQRRLIIIDPENGKQPMKRSHRGEDYIIVYNGMLYNASELRAELEPLGYRFSGHSDTEVLLSAYIEWKEDCLDKLNGIFAVAIWDDSEKKLFLARDRIGVKPLFYYKYDGGIIFGSEIKSILAHPYVKPEIDNEGIASVMLLGPAQMPGNGVFKGIKEIKPGHFAEFYDGGFDIKRYWRLIPRRHDEDVFETAEHLTSLVTDAITRQLVSDVPLCTFLSGGLDSSFISAVAASHFIKQGEVLNTFSVDFKDNDKNFHANEFQPDSDLPWIKRMAEFCGSNHHYVELDTPMLAEALFDACEARDLPGMADVDSSLMLFCREVKRQGFNVVLSGECADELFGGYPWYHNHEILFQDGFPWSTATDERKSLLRKGVLGNISPAEYVRTAYQRTVDDTEYLESDSPIDRRMREMYRLNFNWFMQTLLVRKDRTTMKCGLEARVPFCDYRIAEYAFNIPWEMKAFKGREKGVLRQAAVNILPNDVVWRKKNPYPKTHNPTYLALVMKMFRQILDKPNCRICEIADRGALEALYESHGESFKKNWYGQLMTAPQVFAYFIQTEHWLEKYNINILS